jgi:methylmalonyl-CoA/ethylmalonyl-CoA epimerase|tara:strand:- start:423 stop:833 length:411 start_codon:yes stop_codon:yes gene_type:complete
MSDVSVDHIGIASESIESASGFWELLGFKQSAEHVNDEQGVRIKILEGSVPSAKIELLEPLGSNTPIGRFISKRGEGIQQLAIRVNDIESTIAQLITSGVRMIDEQPVRGASGSIIAFVHPSSTGGVLVELVEYIN